MHFKEIFSIFYQPDKNLFPAWHVPPWLKIGVLFGIVLVVALIIVGILVIVKPEWLDESKAKRDKPQAIQHKGIGQKMKEGIPLTKLEKAAVAYVQLIMT